MTRGNVIHNLPKISEDTVSAI